MARVSYSTRDIMTDEKVRNMIVSAADAVSNLLSTNNDAAPEEIFGRELSDMCLEAITRHSVEK